ncbi:UNVERIFIED_CONTAM: Retrovirus-related Pol polyprotein from transposon TNT 1-94 [Sesamum calycinum]|uniref:Retrovirus-related Pol polyprotein from transposon TNT 1-94 n=1 Tax=Sesamum calycinum TaxID=2727403 RepID=A0AAW2M2D3_9LAMI
MIAKFSKLDKFEDVESAKVLWDALEAKYMTEDASSKKFLSFAYRRISKGARNNKPKGKDVVGSSSVNMVEDCRATKTNDRKGNRKNYDVAWWIDSMLLPIHARFVAGSRVPNKTNKVTPYELWAVVRLPEPKKKSMGGRVNTVIESKDAIFDETRFSFIPRPKGMIPSSRDEVSTLYPYCFNVEDDSKTFDEAMKSQDVAFWKEAINDEMDSIMENNTCVLVDQPLGCKPLGCKWIFKKKMKVDGTIENFKARLVIQDFRQRPGINYFDTYVPVARISTIRFLITLASIHNLVIHQMDVKTIFLNRDLDKEVYMKQPKGFIMPGNEHQVCKLVKSWYGLKQAPKQWHQKFDEVVLSCGYHLNQSDKCVYNKFDNFGNGVIICLYVDDMFIFGTSEQQVDLTKEFLSSRFSMKDMWEAAVTLGIRIIREDKRISISQSHYIEKVLKKFNCFDCTPVSTPMDLSVKLMPNIGEAVFQLEYSKVIGCLMYVMTSIKPDIAYAVGKLSRFTSNPSTYHWKAIRRVLKYLKKIMNYGLSYSGFPSSLEEYSDASWITNVEDHSSTSGWVFLIGGGAISRASKKQTCIINSKMESEFVALAATVKEAEWLRNLINEIPLWPKLISPISIHCDSAATLAKAYSQMHNGKSIHLGVRHSMIRELIMNG